jgi:hypothetical protein
MLAEFSPHRKKETWNLFETPLSVFLSVRVEKIFAEARAALTGFEWLGCLPLIINRSIMGALYGAEYFIGGIK